MNSAPIEAVMIALVAIIVGALIFTSVRKRRSERLRERFGPYDRVLRTQGDAKKAEPVLKFRQQHRDQFNVRALSATDRSSFMYRWNEAQARFVDDPPGAVNLADSVVSDVMQARGYPIADFERQPANISVDHPGVVENYRKAHEIALRQSRGQASTEDLSTAMVHYRSLFQELLDDHQIHKKGA